MTEQDSIRIIGPQHHNAEQILRLVGLDPRRVREATIRIALDEAVTVDAKLYAVEVNTEGNPDGAGSTP